MFISVLSDIFETLAHSPSPRVYETVVKKALPPLSQAIATASKQESYIAESAIELITSLVKGSPESGMGEGVFALLGPNLFKCLQDTEDRNIIQVLKIQTTVGYILTVN